MDRSQRRTGTLRCLSFSWIYRRRHEFWSLFPDSQHSTTPGPRDVRRFPPLEGPRPRKNADGADHRELGLAKRIKRSCIFMIFTETMLKGAFVIDIERREDS